MENSYQPLTFEQFQKAKAAGFSPEKITEMEKQRKAQFTPTEKEHSLIGGLISGALKTPASMATSLVNAEQAARGVPTTHPFSGSYLGDVKPVGDGFDVSHGLNANNVNALKDATGKGVELGSYLIGAPEAKAGVNAIKEGSLLVKPTLKAFVAGGKGAAPAFAANSLGTSMQDSEKGIGQNLIDTAVGGATGFGLGGLLGVGGKALEATGLPSKIIGAIPERIKNTTVKAAHDDADHVSRVLKMVSPVEDSGLKNIAGSKTPTGTGLSGLEKTDQTFFSGSKALPSADTERLAKVAAKEIKPGALPTEAEHQLTQAGTEFANKEMKPFLEQNVPTRNFQEIHNYMQNTPLPEGIVKNSVPAKAFYDTLENATNLLTKQDSQAARDLYTGFDSNEARKLLDKLSKEELGKYDTTSAALTGVKEAIQAIRSRMNKMNEDALRYGDLNKVVNAEKAFSAFKQRGARVGASDSQLFDEMLAHSGVEATPESNLLADKFKNYLQHQKDLLDARNNLKVKNTQKINPKTGKGPSKLREIIDENPVTAALVRNPRTTLGTIGGLTGLGLLAAKK